MALRAPVPLRLPPGARLSSVRPSGLRAAAARPALRGASRPRGARIVTTSSMEEIMDVNTATLYTYLGLGTTAALFGATFFVAPMFKDNFKEEERWEDIYEELCNLPFDTVDPSTAAAMQEGGRGGGLFRKASSGAVVLDVRDQPEFDKIEIPTALHVPLYRPIQDWDVFSSIRRAAFTFFGVAATERNPDFLSEVESVIPKDQEICVVCKMGGALDPGQNKGVKFGFQSRSLKAIYYLKKAGYRKVYHIQGGVGEWGREGLPLEDKVKFKVPGF